jgi:hypothetical protein
MHSPEQHWLFELHVAPRYVHELEPEHTPPTHELLQHSVLVLHAVPRFAQ